MVPKFPRIAVLGSINRDIVIRCARLPQQGETVLADSSSEVAGGKGANQAVAAARLGGQVTMIGRVGDDVFGERLLTGLVREKLDTSLVWQTADCASGMAIVAVEQSGENSIIVVPGANGRFTEDDVAAATDAIGSCDILLLQLEVCTNAVAAAIAVARQKGVRTILNPAPVVDQLPRNLLEVDVMCPNRIEASALAGRPIQSLDDAVSAAWQLSRMGPKSVVITMGSMGAVLSDGGQPEWCEPFPVDSVDTTAAGDAFAGALAVRLGEGAMLREAVQFACAAGAIATTRHGAQPALPSREEVDALLRTRT
ncbi:Ribokinase [Anatilimnocola aggregata]|uniref:Ribokinase n=1 Tax=Anatilimnocola aggregata TaxID=2528021 RepID=A0A517YFS0_9BACT|nr:ribokinase [Anatilimnocola aggregata]QDU29022.1 Ribokinase [Anatilimnocola aggregata]